MTLRPRGQRRARPDLIAIAQEVRVGTELTKLPSIANLLPALARPAAGAGRAGGKMRDDWQRRGSVTFVNADLGGGRLPACAWWVRASRTSTYRPARRDGSSIFAVTASCRDLSTRMTTCSSIAFRRWITARTSATPREWIADVNARLRSMSRPSRQASRCREASASWPGGMKNLLSGVTTVAHHDPLIRVVREAVSRPAWSSIWLVALTLIDGEERVRDSYARTPAAHPWIIHAAEGVDAAAGREFERLRALGCLGQYPACARPCTRKCRARARLRAPERALIWCPSSNLRLFGRAAEVADLLAGAVSRSAPTHALRARAISWMNCG